ncbi:MAG: Gfo/Idh/MocA family oxidoreductase [Ferruginibacter sp.]
MKQLLLILIFTNLLLQVFAQKDTLPAKPLRVAIVGLSHAHVHWILGREKKGDIEIVGIAEPDRDMAERYSKQHGYNMNIVYSSMEEMVQKVKPEAVLAFNSIFDHLKVVEYCAPLGVHVMVEKPMAVSVEHAEKMLSLAKKHHIILMTNYETTWYGSNEKAWQIVKEEKTIGDIRKVVFHTGHKGPKEIGCNKEFLDWLTDPVLNGGGALTDFGCYGADISTWLMKGEHPETVTAVTQQIKPDIYPKVDDEATIILTYKKAQVIIQASWNWPYNRKDMQVYGVNGYVLCKDATNMVVKESESKEPETIVAKALPADRDDPFIYFKNVIRGNIKLDTYDLSAPATNEIVVKILEAASKSAKSGQTISWTALYK